MDTSKSPRQNEDLISNVLDILSDRILEVLPIRDVARTSVLSKQWRCNWLSLRRLVFDADLFEDLSGNWQERRDIISGILLKHNGPVHEFSLFIPHEAKASEVCANIDEWLSFLSRNEVRRIKIFRHINHMTISSNIFWCSELVNLELDNFTLHPPPSGFSGFPKLQNLVLCEIEFSQEDIFPRLMANCSKIVTLTLMYCNGMGHIVLDVPNLETLTFNIAWDSESIAFRDVSNLKSIEVSSWERLGKALNIETIDSFKNLARSRQLQCINFGSQFCKFLAAASLKRPLPVRFNHLTNLSLSWIDLRLVDIQRNIFYMIECCPYMKELDISIHHSRKNDEIHEKLDCTKIRKSPCLVEVTITGITGSAVELQLIENLLTIAVALERLFYDSDNHDIESELELLKALAGMPRASPKACVVSLM